jgi:hypothetical protein
MPETLLTADHRASVLIDNVAESLSADQVTAGELLQKLDGRGIGILLLIFSLPICIPNIPGISTLFGLLLITPSIQMISGNKSVWMPAFIRNGSFSGAGLRKALHVCASLMRKVEFLARPRLRFLARWPVTSVAGIQVLIMALVLLLPMPGANVIPGVSVALTGLALLQRDGLMMLLSTLVAAGALVWVYLGGKYVIQFFTWAYESGLSLTASLF